MIAQRLKLSQIISIIVLIVLIVVGIVVFFNYNSSKYANEYIGTWKLQKVTYEGQSIKKKGIDKIPAGCTLTLYKDGKANMRFSHGANTTSTWEMDEDKIIIDELNVVTNTTKVINIKSKGILYTFKKINSDTPETNFVTGNMKKEFEDAFYVFAIEVPLQNSDNEEEIREEMDQAYQYRSDVPYNASEIWEEDQEQAAMDSLARDAWNDYIYDGGGDSGIIREWPLTPY